MRLQLHYTKVSGIHTHTGSPGVKSMLNEPAEFQMCRILIQAIKVLVVYILNSASQKKKKTIEASPLKKPTYCVFFQLQSLAEIKKKKTNAWCLFVCVDDGGVCECVRFCTICLFSVCLCTNYLKPSEL